MKATVFFLFLIFNFNLYSQSEKIAGEYYYNSDEKGHIIQYKLTLKSNGTYEFHSYSKVPAGISQVSYDYGEGKWSMENDDNSINGNSIVTFFAFKEKEIENNTTINLNNSKALFITETKNKTDAIPVAKLKFIKSDVFWIEGIEVLRKLKV